MLVEGSTERKVLPTFLSKWLNPHLPERVGIDPVKVKGLKDLLKKADLYLHGRNANKIIGVIGLLDLYGFDEIKQENRSKNEYYEYASSKITKDVSNDKFRMFFAVHETEAWLLCKPDLFPPDIKRELSKYSPPEDVDFDEPPAKLLKRLYREKLKKTYGKTIDGFDLFKNLDPIIAHNKCPYLAKMLDDMLSMAQAALSE